MVLNIQLAHPDVLTLGLTDLLSRAVPVLRCHEKPRIEGGIQYI